MPSAVTSAAVGRDDQSVVGHRRLERTAVFADQLGQAGVIAHGSDDQPSRVEGPPYVGPDRRLVHEVDDPDRRLPRARADGRERQRARVGGAQAAVAVHVAAGCTDVEHVVEGVPVRFRLRRAPVEEEERTSMQDGHRGRLAPEPAERGVVQEHPGGRPGAVRAADDDGGARFANSLHEVRRRAEPVVDEHGSVAELAPVLGEREPRKQPAHLQAGRLTAAHRDDRVFGSDAEGSARRRAPR